MLQRDEVPGPMLKSFFEKCLNNKEDVAYCRKYYSEKTKWRNKKNMNENIEKKLNEYMQESLFYYDLPGLVVTAGKGDFVYRKAVGFSDFEKKEELTETQFFHMASVSKTFVSTAIMKLVEEKKLDLNQKIVEILPWFKIEDERIEDITIKAIITHTAGLPTFKEYNWNKPMIDKMALKDFVMSEDIAKTKLLWSPKENKFQYSDMGFEILGCVVSEISGTSFEEYVALNFLKPLGMENTTFLTFRRGMKAFDGDIDIQIDGNFDINNEFDNMQNTDSSLQAAKFLDLDVLKKVGAAMPHYKNKENHICLEDCYPYNRRHAPSSTLTSDIYDMEKWARAAIDRTLLLEETYEKIWTGQTIVPNNGEQMGVGWFIRNEDGLEFLGHEGTDDGFRSSFWICPEKDAFVIVMSNISRAPVKKINKGVFERLCCD